MSRPVPIGSLLLVLLLWAPKGASAQAGTDPGLEQEPAPTAALTDSVRSIDPGRALLRSALLPGWGQFYVGKPVKGVVFATGAASLLGLTFYCDSQVRDLAGRRDPGLTALERATLETDIEHWRTRRRRWILWTVGLWLYNLADAFVDAHLADFDREEPRFEITPVPPPDATGAPTCWLGVRLAIGR